MSLVRERDRDRKELLADAAIELIGADGLRALTHRAVDSRAGLPQGTCSYHFPSRRALLGAALERIAVLDAGEAEHGPDPAELMAHWLTAGRTRTRARLILMLDPESRTEVGDLADRLTQGFVERAAALLGDRSRARLLVALLDGLALDELIRGDGTPSSINDVRARVRAILEVVGISGDPEPRSPARRARVGRR